MKPHPRTASKAASPRCGRSPSPTVGRSVCGRTASGKWARCIRDGYCQHPNSGHPRAREFVFEHGDRNSPAMFRRRRHVSLSGLAARLTGNPYLTAARRTAGPSAAGAGRACSGRDGSTTAVKRAADPDEQTRLACGRCFDLRTVPKIMQSIITSGRSPKGKGGSGSDDPSYPWPGVVS